MDSQLESYFKAYNVVIEMLKDRKYTMVEETASKADPESDEESVDESVEESGSQLGGVKKKKTDKKKNKFDPTKFYKSMDEFAIMFKNDIMIMKDITDRSKTPVYVKFCENQDVYDLVEFGNMIVLMKY